MADIDSSLPVFSLAESAPISVSATTDANTAANPIFTQLSDGTTVLGTTGGALDVNVTSMAATAVDDSPFGIAVDDVTPIGFLADEASPDSVDEGDTGIARMTLDRKILTRIVGASDADRLDINSSGEALVDLASISTTDVLAVSKDNSANAETNPLFVQVVSGIVSGIEVVDFDTASAVAKDATSDHDFTVTGGKTLKVRRTFGSASGSQKVEIQSGPLASLVTVAVEFTSGANKNWEVVWEGLLEVPDTSTGTLRIQRTNRDQASQDVYSTIIGTEV